MAPSMAHMRKALYAAHEQYTAAYEAVQLDRSGLGFRTPPSQEQLGRFESTARTLRSIECKAVAALSPDVLRKWHACSAVSVRVAPDAEATSVAAVQPGGAPASSEVALSRSVTQMKSMLIMGMIYADTTDLLPALHAHWQCTQRCGAQAQRGGLQPAQPAMQPC